MADEILYAGIANLRTAEALSTEFLFQYAAREALPQHPALIYGGDAQGRGSVTLKIPVAGLMGYDLLAATGDGSQVANSPLTDAVITVTVGRYSKSYERSDLARLQDALGVLRADMFALDAIASLATTLTSLVANVADDFTTFVGTSGADLTAAQFLSAIALLEIANVPPPYLSILHGRQVGDLRENLAAISAGALQWMDATQQQIELLGTGYRGKFGGVDLFATNHVPSANAGADRAGSMFGRGAIVWADGSVPPEGDPNQLPIGGGKLLVERDRTAKAGLTAWVSHANLGVVKALNAGGVSIITDL